MQKTNQNKYKKVKDPLSEGYADVLSMHHSYLFLGMHLRVFVPKKDNPLFDRIKKEPTRLNSYPILFEQTIGSNFYEISQVENWSEETNGIILSLTIKQIDNLTLCKRVNRQRYLYDKQSKPKST